MWAGRSCPTRPVSHWTWTWLGCGSPICWTTWRCGTSPSTPSRWTPSQWTSAVEPALFDPFDGQADLARGLLRAVTEGAFRDDPLRMLRGVRMVAELGFRIEDATYNLIRRDAPLIQNVSGERVRDELMRILAAPGAWQHLRLLAALGLLRYTLPESAAQIGVAQSAPHYQDVFDHTRSVLAHLEGIYALLWPESGYTLPQPVPDDPTVVADGGAVGRGGGHVGALCRRSARASEPAAGRPVTRAGICCCGRR